jgi:ankyrin repeat protein
MLKLIALLRGVVMPVQEKAAILKLLNDMKALITPKSPAAHDYQSLKTNIVNQELKEEVAALSALLNDEEGFVEGFKDRCQERAMRHADSCLNFVAMPDGACNQLYIKIAALLFSPKTMGDWVSILIPQVTTYVTLDYSLQSVKPSTKYTSIKFINNNILAFSTAMTADELSRCVIAGSHLFYIEEIAKFDFHLHKTLRENLMNSYPALARKLYQHNPTLKKLEQHLLMVSGKEQTPIEVITSFIHKLCLGGSSITGRENASIQAHEAFNDFLEYLESLPEEMKASLMSLNRAEGHPKSFKSVMDDLKNGNCVETAATHLKAIIENPANQAVLTMHPHLGKESLKAIEKQYRRGSQVPTSEDNSTLALPAYLLEKSLSQIKIETAHDYLSLLLSFPHTLYAPLLEQAQILAKPPLPLALGDMIENGVFNQEQLQAFYKAVYANYKKFGSLFTILHHPESLKTVLALYPEQDRLAAVREKDSYGNTVLHVVANNPESLKAIFELLPAQDPLTAVKEKDRYGHTVLRLATHNPESLKIVLAQYPEQDRLAAVKEKDRYGHTVLRLATYNPESLKIVLAQYPEQDRLAAVKEKDQLDKTILHLAARNPESLKTVLDIYPEQDRLAAVEEKDKFGNTVLHLATRNPESLKTVLAIYPVRGRLAAVKKKDSDGKSVLEWAFAHPESLKAIFELLSEQDHLTAVKENEGYGLTVLHLMTHKPESLKAIFGLLSEQNRLNAVKEKDMFGNAVLHYAADNPESLKAIFELLSEQNRLTAVKEKNSYGRTVLHLAANNPESLKTILEFLPKQDRLTAVKEKVSNGYTVLETAKNGRSSLQGVLQLLPFPTSYHRLKEKSLCSLLQARDLLNDYTKHNSAVSRFFHGHWNRNHVKEVSVIVNNIDSKKILNVEDLMSELNKIKLKNTLGSLARRMAFIANLPSDGDLLPTHSFSNTGGTQ